MAEPRRRGAHRTGHVPALDPGATRSDVGPHASPDGKGPTALPPAPQDDRS